MSKENGFVLDWKDKLQWRWFKDPKTAHLFEYFTLAANFKDGYFENETIRRGECVGSYAIFANETGLSVQEVRTSLKKLVSTGEVTKRSCSKFTIVTVSNYDEHQLSTNISTSGSTNEQQDNNTPATNEQQAINNNRNKDNKEINIKEVDNKKEKNIKKESFSIPSEIEEAFRGFSEMRTKIKKPLTDRAKKMALHQLQELAGNDYDLQRKILDQSTMQCWQGLFPLKADKQNGGGKNGTTRSVAIETMSSRVF